ncbi:MAG TPA: hypothetical protein VFN05_01440, partial [Actinomycetes bacterium]|nr:hypothetical protein [Actinomycetes bacterium]
MRRSLLTVSVALAGVLVLALPANAAIDRPVAVWQMNEPAGSQVMVDSSSNGRNGAIGAEVEEGTALVGGGAGYRLPYLRPNTPPAHPEHLAVVPHSDALNPGSGGYAVEFRMRTTRNFGNVLQKGPAGSPGGYWKFEQPSGKIACLF